MTIPGFGSSDWATVPDSASEDGGIQGQGAKLQRGAMEDCPTLSRRSLLVQAASLLALYVVTVPGPVAALGLPRSLPEATVQQMKEEARQDVKAVLNQIKRDVPGLEVAATAGGSLLGGLGSTALLYGLGIPGLAAPGIATALATAGALVGGGMAAGVTVLAMPVVGLGVGGYAIASAMKSRGTKSVEKLQHAIQELRTIAARLKPTRQFHSEIAEIKTYIKELELEGQKYKLT